jgi:HK97 family phage major capsid protein
MTVKKEGECTEEQISANIAKLIKEGKPRDQAVAIAFEGCPQQKADSQLFTQEEARYSQTVHPYSNAQVEGITVSPTCGNCVFFNRNEGQLDSCLIVENQPLEIVAEGQCTKWVGISHVKDAEQLVYIGGAIKAIGDEGRIGGYLVRFAGPNMKDLQGEYFTKDSELELDWYDKRPILFHHGGDTSVKGVAIGKIDTIRVDDEGVWAEGVLNLRQKYVQSIFRMVKEGILDWSSGTLPQLIEVAKDGFIKRWPIVEGSTTPTPAMPFNVTRIHTVKGLVKASKGTIPELFEDAQAGENSVFYTLFDRTSMKGNDMMSPEQIAEIREVVEPIIREILNSMMGEKQVMEEDEEEIEIAKQAMEDEAEEILKEELKAEDTQEEEEDEGVVGKAAQSILLKNATAIALAGMKAIAEHRNAYKKSIALAVREAAGTLGKDMVVYGRAKSNVGGAEGKGFGNFNKQAYKAFDEAPISYAVKARSKHGSDDAELQAWFKAQSADIGPRGAFIAAPPIQEDLLDQLRPQLFLDKVGAQITPVDGNQAVQRPRLVTSPEAEWLGEADAATENEYATDMMIATPKPLVAHYALPIALLGRMTAADEATLRKNLTKSMMISIDRAALRGVGTVSGSNTGGEPLGLLPRTEANDFDEPSRVDVQDLDETARNPMPDDMNGIVQAVMDADVLLTDDAHWVYRPKTLQYFKNLSDTTGQLLKEEQWTQGYTPVTTNNVEDRVGTASNATRIYFGEWSFFEMVMSRQIEMVVLDGDTFTRKLQVGILAYVYVDFLVHHGPAFAVREEVLI